MTLKLTSEITLPAHQGKGGFDHAAFYSPTGQLYVAHTANDSLEIIDCATDTHVGTLNGFTGIAGALVSEERQLIFTSNRGENSVSLFPPSKPHESKKVKVGIRPNGLAFDPERGILLAANVGDAANPESFTLSFVSIKTGALISELRIPGRTRWSIFDPITSTFYINIADPACIICVSTENLEVISRTFDIAGKGPHGLDIDLATRTLFCACDSGHLVSLNADSGKMISRVPLAGTPDVIFFNKKFGHLYVTTGDPGVIEVFQTSTLRLLETVKTERGAHTIGYDWDRQKIYALLPESCKALVFQDSET
jgi:DNA-binding beta-propeller fold protein YncE